MNLHPILLCSGPGAEDAIMWSEIISLASFVLLVVLELALFFSKRISKKARVILLLLILIHPYIWMSARGGDCGYVKRFSSIALALVFLAVWLFVLIRKRKSDAPAS